jgi:hypothetical protein
MGSKPRPAQNRAPFGWCWPAPPATSNDVAPDHVGIYFVNKAQAIVGRLATPMSYAGVARRTTRREAHGVGAYGGYRGYGYGAGASAPVGAAADGAATYGAGNCVQVTDVYGRLVTSVTDAVRHRRSDCSASRTPS